jgi:hypothetical protein
MRRRSRPKTTLGSALVVALALVGCGSSGSTSQSSATQAASATQTTAASTAASTAAPPTSTSTSTATGGTSTHAHRSTSPKKASVLDILVRSSTKLDPISARYTCDGANLSLPVSWSKIPARTAEIDLFVVNAAPVNDKLVADWAVAGLKPSLHKLSAGQLPPGAVLGRNSFGQSRYTLCPPKGSTVHYFIGLYALAHRIPVKPGFAADALQERANQASEHAGLLGFFYERT